MKINIHYKITIIFTIILAIILFGIYLSLNDNLKTNTYQRIKTNLFKETALCKSFIEQHYIQNLQSQELDNFLHEIADDLNLRVTIINLEGTVLADSEVNRDILGKVENHLYRPEIQQALHSGIGESRRFSTTVKKDMLYVASTIGRNKPEGIIRLSMPLAEIELISNHLKKLLIVSLLFAFFLAIIISFAASMFISQPIKKMSLFAQDIAKGDFSKRILNFTNDEFGDLAKAFNYMSEQIKLKINEVNLSKSRFEAILLSMFEGVMVVDTKGTILLMNRALKDLLQVKDEFVNKKPLEILRNIEIQEIVDNTLKLKQGVESREISVLFPEEKILLIHATPVVRENETEGAVLVFHDITSLRELEKIRKDFVANVSHELRTPVASIKGYAETLLDGALEDKNNAKDFLKIIYTDIDRLARLIDDLLNLSRIESGKFKMNLQLCAIAPIIKGVVSRLNKQARDKSITIKTNIPEKLDSLLIDETRIAQVLFNLIDNAIKYIPEKGNIIISVNEKDGFIQINIADTGSGIAQEHIPRLFERFYRVDKSRSQELGGTGLGLAIVKHIIQAHQGEVFVQSILGQGSVFSFTLPKA
ncbi:HAMP domain-containing protein, partial [bacterium]|nr:HAMP domain-containing protein [bacterium]